jgi:hypothetical protein
MGVPQDRVIEGTVVADKLVVGELGLCGSTSVGQLDWFRKGIRQRLGHPPMRKKILFLSRGSSGPSNSESILQSIQTFAKEHGWETYHHNDQTLPSLEYQLGNFSESAIIVAPHGAGSTLLFGTLPKACFIELLAPNDRFNLMYGEIAGRLSLEYFGLLMAEWRVSPETILETIQSCSIFQRFEQSANPPQW